MEAENQMCIEEVIDAAEGVSIYLVMIKLKLVQVVENKSPRLTSIFRTKVLSKGQPYTLIIDDCSEWCFSRACQNVRIDTWNTSKVISSCVGKHK